MEEKTLSKIVVKFVFDFTTALQDKIKQRERSVVENGLKTCPAEEFSPSCEKARDSVAYKLCECTTEKILLDPKFACFTAVGC